MKKRAATNQMRLALFRAPSCPDCGGPVVRGEGSFTCAVCGFVRSYV